MRTAIEIISEQEHSVAVLYTKNTEFIPYIRIYMFIYTAQLGVHLEKLYIWCIFSWLNEYSYIFYKYASTKWPLKGNSLKYIPITIYIPCFDELDPQV